MREPTRWGVFLSRVANRAMFGRWETICSRVHRRGWIVIELQIDIMFSPWDEDHCRMMHEWEAGE